MTAPFDRKVVMALFIIFALVLVGAAVGIYRHEAGKLSGLQAQLRADQARLEDVKTKITRMPQLEVEFAQLGQRLAVLEKPLPDVAYIPTFLRQIEGLAVDTNNRIVMIRPRKKQKNAATKSAVKMNNETGEVTTDEGGAGDKESGKTAKEKKKPELPYEFVPIEMKIEGTYWTTLDFLKKLQRFPKMIAVNSIGFAPRPSGTEAGGSPDLNVTLDLMAVVTKGAKDGKS